MDWSSEQYRKFENERTRPVRDLIAAIPTRSVQRAVDLGCGPGNSTEVLAARFPEAQITGLDSSPAMIEAAKKRLPSLRFELADIRQWQAEELFDVILSNATLQWLPDHDTLLPSLMARLTPGGSLAIQMPDNLKEPTHTSMPLAAKGAIWEEKLRAAAGERTEIASAERYYEILKPHAREIDIWRTTYTHVLTGGLQAIVEWFKSTGLRPYLAPLNTDEQAEFLDRYKRLLAEHYRVLEGDVVLLPFPRLFIVAQR